MEGSERVLLDGGLLCQSKNIDLGNIKRENKFLGHLHGLHF